MALTKLKTKDIYGKTLEFQNSYIKISDISGNKNRMTLLIDTFSKLDGEVIDNMQYTFLVTLDGKNFIAQGYDYLKTLPEFADAVDC